MSIHPENLKVAEHSRRELAWIVHSFCVLIVRRKLGAEWGFVDKPRLKAQNEQSVRPEPRMGLGWKNKK